MVIAVLMALTVSGAAHAAHEAVEDLVHVATEGHSAHGNDHPEGRRASGTEHDCAGFVHHCQCCTTAVAACTTTALSVDPAPVRELGAPTTDAVDAAGVHDRIDRPPQH